MQQRRIDQLQGLDDVRWEELRVAYGVAEEVPENIRGLWMSRSPDEAANWEHKLWLSVLHSGSVYTATPSALRFILPLFAEPSHPAVPVIVNWLADLDRVFEWDGHDEVVEQVRGVVVENWPAIRALFSHPDPEVRSTGVGSASAFRTVTAEVADALAERWQQEPNDVVRAEILFSAAVVAARSGDAADVRGWIADWWDDVDRYRRGAAACAWCRLDPAAVEAMDFLLTLLPDGLRSSASWDEYWGIGRPPLIVELWAAQQNRDLGSDIEAVILAVLSHSFEQPLSDLLRRVFPTGRAGMPDAAAKLDPVQRRVLAELAQHPEMFRNGNVDYPTQWVMGSFHLPSDAPSLRRWLRGAPRVDCLSPAIREAASRDAQ